MLATLLRPKIVAGALVIALVAGGAWHYRHVIAKNAELTARVLELMGQNDSLEQQVKAERKAAETAVRERVRAQRALNDLRAGQASDTDPEYLEWAAQRVPPTETRRICDALPRMDGCKRD